MKNFDLKSYNSDYKSDHSDDSDYSDMLISSFHNLQSKHQQTQLVQTYQLHQANQLKILQDLCNTNYSQFNQSHTDLFESTISLDSPLDQVFKSLNEKFNQISKVHTMVQDTLQKELINLESHNCNNQDTDQYKNKRGRGLSGTSNIQIEPLDLYGNERTPKDQEIFDQQKLSHNQVQNIQTLRYQEQIKEKDHQINLLTEELKEYKLQVTSLVTIERSQINAMEKENTHLLKIQEKTQALNALRSEQLKYKKQTDESIRQSGIRDKTHENEVQKLKKEIESLHVQLGHLKGEKEVENDKHKKIVVSKELNQNKQIENLISEKNKFQEMNKSLEETLSSNQYLYQKEQSNLNNKIINLNKELSEIKKESKNQEKTVNDLNIQIQKQKDDLILTNNQINLKDNENDQLMSKQNSIKSDWEKNFKENNILSERVKLMKLQIERVQGDLNYQTNKTQSISNDLIESNKAKEELKVQNMQMSNKIEEINLINANHEEKLSKKFDENQKLILERSDYQSKLNSLREDIVKIESLIDEKDNSQNTVQSNLLESEKTVLKLKNCNDNLSEEYESLNTKQDELKADNHQLKQNQIDLNQKYDKTQSDLIRLNSINNELKMNIENNELQNKSYHSDLEIMSTNLNASSKLIQEQSEILDLINQKLIDSSDTQSIYYQRNYYQNKSLNNRKYDLSKMKDFLLNIPTLKQNKDQSTITTSTSTSILTQTENQNQSIEIQTNEIEIGNSLNMELSSENNQLINDESIIMKSATKPNHGLESKQRQHSSRFSNIQSKSTNASASITYKSLRRSKSPYNLNTSNNKSPNNSVSPLNLSKPEIKRDYSEIKENLCDVSKSFESVFNNLKGALLSNQHNSADTTLYNQSFNKSCTDIPNYQNTNQSKVNELEQQIINLQTQNQHLKNNLNSQLEEVNRIRDEQSKKALDLENIANSLDSENVSSKKKLDSSRQVINQLQSLLEQSEITYNKFRDTSNGKLATYQSVIEDLNSKLNQTEEAKSLIEADLSNFKSISYETNCRIEEYENILDEQKTQIDDSMVKIDLQHEINHQFKNSFSKLFSSIHIQLDENFENDFNYVNEKVGLVVDKMLNQDNYQDNITKYDQVNVSNKLSKITLKDQFIVTDLIIDDDYFNENTERNDELINEVVEQQEEIISLRIKIERLEEEILEINTKMNDSNNNQLFEINNLNNSLSELKLAQENQISELNTKQREISMKQDSLVNKNVHLKNANINQQSVESVDKEIIKELSNSIANQTNYVPEIKVNQNVKLNIDINEINSNLKHYTNKSSQFLQEIQNQFNQVDKKIYSLSRVTDKIRTNKDENEVNQQKVLDEKIKIQKELNNFKQQPNYSQKNNSFCSNESSNTAFRSIYSYKTPNFNENKELISKDLKDFHYTELKDCLEKTISENNLLRKELLKQNEDLNSIQNLNIKIKSMIDSQEIINSSCKKLQVALDSLNEEQKIIAQDSILRYGNNELEQFIDQVLAAIGFKIIKTNIEDKIDHIYKFIVDYNLQKDKIKMYKDKLKYFFVNIDPSKDMIQMIEKKQIREIIKDLKSINEEIDFTNTPHYQFIAIDKSNITSSLYQNEIDYYQGRHSITDINQFNKLNYNLESINDKLTHSIHVNQSGDEIPEVVRILQAVQKSLCDIREIKENNYNLTKNQQYDSIGSLIEGISLKISEVSTYPEQAQVYEVQELLKLQFNQKRLISKLMK